MISTHHVQLLAQYNQWMNEKVYAAAGALSSDQLTQDKGAFFRSILGTLNHLAVADIVWLRRFAQHPSGFPSLEVMAEFPQPAALDQILAPLGDLAQMRRKLDAIITAWAEEITEEHLVQPLEYRSMKGLQFRKPFADVVLHFFNHQTHHRGQATTLLTQEGRDVGVTDLLVLIPEAADTP